MNIEKPWKSRKKIRGDSVFKFKDWLIAMSDHVYDQYCLPNLSLWMLIQFLKTSAYSLDNPIFSTGLDFLFVTTDVHLTFEIGTRIPL